MPSARGRSVEPCVRFDGYAERLGMGASRRAAGAARRLCTCSPLADHRSTACRRCFATRASLRLLDHGPAVTRFASRLRMASDCYIVSLMSRKDGLVRKHRTTGAEQHGHPARTSQSTQLSCHDGLASTEQGVARRRLAIPPQGSRAHPREPGTGSTLTGPVVRSSKAWHSEPKIHARMLRNCFR
jgi:hypothetical protein